MKWFLLILVLITGGFICQAQELPEDWYKMADTSFVESDSVVSIAKGESIDYSTSQKIALLNAKAKVLNLLNLYKMTMSVDVVAAKTFFDKSTQRYSHYVAIKVKKPYQLKIKKIEFKD